MLQGARCSLKIHSSIITVRIQSYNLIVLLNKWALTKVVKFVIMYT